MQNVVSRKQVERKAERFLRKTQRIGGNRSAVPDADFRNAVKVTVDRSLKTLRAKRVKIKT